eukprot:Pompholyxophrys_punicea_v1_NODE_1123_length_937_cov_4.407029.p2 type:complete len:113 gc:universal NODE_1123_length_937_cov_4.407029:827-489(-)
MTALAGKSADIVRADMTGFRTTPSAHSNEYSPLENFLRDDKSGTRNKLTSGLDLPNHRPATVTSSNLFSFGKSCPKYKRGHICQVLEVKIDIPSKKNPKERFPNSARNFCSK